VPPLHSGTRLLLPDIECSDDLQTRTLNYANAVTIHGCLKAKEFVLAPDVKCPTRSKRLRVIEVKYRGILDSWLFG
jgi:hypothetical protein